MPALVCKRLHLCDETITEVQGYLDRSVCCCDERDIVPSDDHQLKRKYRVFSHPPSRRISVTQSLEECTLRSLTALCAKVREEFFIANMCQSPDAFAHRVAICLNNPD